ncbi:hypothetical protein SteCoe_34130 [Stentor coeruleus]|uniref:Uncharacterized protein n=1 Tax=Stentor coeruleus TaxID=5963 RepID=A0A1R2AV63_9CILI|nr:hypothetical protein SteCoe_34130 [Stentor coeruleus]
MCIFILEWVFFLIALRWISGLCFELYDMKKALSRKSNINKYNRGWALITASTDGIGLGFAEELAKKGFNIIQVSRNPTKMQDIARRLKINYLVDVINIKFDFQGALQNPIKNYLAIYEEIKDFDISIIINNIGSTSVGFLKSQEALIMQNSLNLWPITMLTRLILPILQRREKGGGIINISSISSVKSLALKGMALYAAGKAYGKAMSYILDIESNSKVDILCLTPGWVDTPLTKPFGNKRNRLITPNELACEALKQLGNVTCSFGHHNHWLGYYETQFVVLKNHIKNIFYYKS